MEVHVSVVDGNQSAELESLDEWLSGEPELSGRVRLDGAKPQPGDMGAATDVLVVAVGAGGAVSVLASSLKAWLSLPRRSDIRVRLRRKDGQMIDIDGKNVKDKVVEKFLQYSLDSDGPG